VTATLAREEARANRDLFVATSFGGILLLHPLLALLKLFHKQSVVLISPEDETKHYEP
jgi:hypothetical protein